MENVYPYLNRSDFPVRFVLSQQPTQIVLRFLVVAGVLFLSVPRPVQADIYKYIDENGVLHFTNVPTQSGYRLYVRERPSKLFRKRSSNRYDHLIQQAADRYGLSFPLLKALIKVESDFNPKAVSKAGALGLMQIMPGNLREFRVDNPFDPWENIRGGAWYLNQLIDRFEGRVPLALAAYNAGPKRTKHFRFKDNRPASIPIPIAIPTSSICGCAFSRHGGVLTETRFT